MDLYLNRPLKEIRFTEVFQQMMVLCFRFRLRLPAERFLMLKVLVQAEDLGRKLDPEFDMAEHLAPFIARMRLERFHPSRVTAEFLEAAGDLLQVMKGLPRDLRDLAAQVKEGKGRVRLEHRGLDEFIHEMDRSSNRLSFSLVLAALIVGSSLIIVTDTGPRLFGLPFLGVLGFCLAALFGLRLMIAIWRSGKL